MPKKSLTQLAVDRIKPPTDKPREEHFDSNQPGFALRVTDKGHKSWIVLYRLRGQSKIERYTIGSLEDFPKVEKARDIARDVRQKAARGEDPKAARKAQPTAAKAGLTVDDLIEEYLMRWARPKKRSADADERMLRRELLGKDMMGADVAGVDLADVWRGRPIAEIARRDIVLLLDRIVDRGSPIMANRVLAGVRRMFNFAIERGILDSSPCVKIKPPGEERERERNLSDDEIRIVWPALDRSGMEHNIRRVLRFMLASGARKGEVLGMRESEINRKDLTWTIPAERVKNKRDHVVPLSALALEIIDDATAGDEGEGGSAQLAPKPSGGARPEGGGPAAGRDLIFISPRTGKQYEERSVDHAVRDLYSHRPPPKGKKPSTKPKRALALEGFEPFTPHDLRRTAATEMRALGITKEDVKLVLNHKDRSVTGRHYDKYEGLREKRHALNVWARHLTTLIRPAPANVAELPRTA